MTTSKKKKKTRKRMNGSRFCFVLAMLASVDGSLPAQQKIQPQAYAVVAGTVFHDPGLALPGAKVVLTLRGDVKRKKLQEAETNSHGEFAFRVPPTDATYIVKASIKGYLPDEKEAAVSGEVRVDVNLLLEPQPKK
jgi:hypothetical protein